MTTGYSSTLARTIKRVALAVPASGASGVQLLASLSADEATRCLGVRILPKLVDGTTDRPALSLGDVALMTNASSYAAGSDVYEPTIQGPSEFIRSLSTGFTAQVVFYLS